MNNQAQRVATAAVAIPLAAVAVWYGGLPLVALIAVIAWLATGELFSLGERTGVRALRGLGMLLASLIPLVTWVVVTPLDRGLDPIEGFVASALAPVWLWVQWPLAVVLAPLVVLTLVLFRRGPGQRPLEAAALTLLGPLYCGLLPSSLLLIRFAGGPDRSLAGASLVFFPLAVTWLCDSFAMWGGKAIGGPKLWPEISPGKTRAGGIAGLVGGVATAVAYVPLVLVPLGHPIPLLQAAVMGLVISVVAQLGDLVESLFKREAGVKDSGSLIPGHGGVLDRFDSLYFVLPVTTLMFRGFGVL